jgi:hypothetical protein
MFLNFPFWVATLASISRAKTIQNSDRLMFLRGYLLKKRKGLSTPTLPSFSKHLQGFRRDFQKINCSHLSLTLNHTVKLDASKEHLSLNPFCNKAFSFSRHLIFSS